MTDREPVVAELRGYRNPCPKCKGEGCPSCDLTGYVWERGNLLKPGFWPRYGELDLLTGEFFDD